MAGVFFRSQSAIDGSNIIVAAVLPESVSNVKTGQLAQIYILPAHAEPHQAFKSGEYSGVCGDCPHQGGACYVNRIHGSLGVYRAVHRGKSYREVTPVEMGEVLAGYAVRLGADGDPAAIPADELQAIMANVQEWTGYTHQWKQERFAHLSAYCMASCDTLQQAEAARSKGWRTFRTMLPDESKVAGEFVCPASEEAGKRKTCAECLACDGIGSNGRRAHPVIMAHGPAHKVRKYKEFRLSLIA